MGKEKAKLEVGRLVEEFSKYPKEEIDSMPEEQIKFRFIEPLFEVLGWKKENIEKETRVLKGRADYILKIGNQNKLVIEAKKTSVRLEEKEGRQAVSYAHHKNIKFSVLTNFKYLRVYHALSNIKNIDKNLLKNEQGYFILEAKEFVERFDLLWLLSKESFEKEEINKLLKNVDKKLIKPIDESILADLLQFREWLSKDLKSKRMQLEDSQIDEVVQILIDRLIFMRSVEDRGLEGKDFLLTIIDSVEKRITDKNLWALLKEQFKRFDGTYNSKLFAEGLLEKEGAFADDVLIKTIKGLYYGTSHQQERYMFDEIPVDLLGSIYEQYLGTILRGTEKRVKLDLVSGKRKKMGIYYTPSYIVDYIVKNTIGEYCKDKFLDEILDIKIVDPACGSGSFLIKAFQELINIVEERLKKGEKSKKYKSFQKWEGKLSLGEKATILTNCIYGVDLDEKAVELAQLNLLLKILEEETRETRKKILPNMKDNIKNGNSLISDSKFEKAFNWNAQFPDVFKDGGFEVVVGNPPYVRPHNLDIKTKEYLWKNLKTFKAKSDLYNCFMEKGINLMKEGGLFAFIVPHTWTSLESFYEIRKYLLENSDVIKLTQLPKKVFQEATVETCIFILSKEKDKDKRDNNIILVERLNEKDEILFVKEFKQVQLKENHLYNFELYSKGEDSPLLNKIKENGKKLSESIRFFYGLKTGDDKKFISNKKINKDYKKLLRSKDIGKYFIEFRNKYVWYVPEIMVKNKKTARPGDKDRFETEKIIVARMGKEVVAVYENENYYVKDGMILLKKSEEDNLKYIVGILNSNLINYYYKNYFITIDVLKNALLELPIASPSPAQEQRIIVLVEQMLELQKKIHSEGVSGNEKEQLEQQIKNVDYEIDEEVYGLYGINEEEKRVIEGKEDV